MAKIIWRRKIPSKSRNPRVIYGNKITHRHNGSYRSRTPKGNVVYKRKPIHNQMLKYKNKPYPYLKKKFNISKYGDDDRDKVPNIKDCRPWDTTRHMAWDIEKAKEEAKSRGVDLDIVNIEDVDLRRREDLELAEGDKVFYDTEKDEYRPIEELADYIESREISVEVPSAIVEDGKVVISEGRHRAMAAEEGGHKTIPVLIDKNQEKEVRERIKEWEEIEEERRKEREKEEEERKSEEKIEDLEGKQVYVNGKLATVSEVRNSSKIGVEFEDGTTKWVDIIDITEA